MRCVQCGQEITAGRPYCQGCGARTSNPASQEFPQYPLIPEQSPYLSESRPAYYYEQAAPSAYQAPMMPVYYPPPAQGGYYYPYSRPAPAPTRSGTVLAAFIFALITTILLGYLVVPLAWMIPMTVMMWGMYKGTRQNSVAFGVCSLLFVNMISGILLLVDGGKGS